MGRVTSSKSAREGSAPRFGASSLVGIIEKSFHSSVSLGDRYDRTGNTNKPFNWLSVAFVLAERRVSASS